MNIDCEYLHHTERAILIRGADEKERWLPLSAVDEENVDFDPNEIVRGTPITLPVARWLAEREGLV